ncbi:Ankyrin repeat-containing protein [Andreprevotia lacus DSM 23236]|jgi:ankyrin repeat protein|uniref:Ankyrin repeat-containing protein n=1 Tax=Andreprevotia lacus DSM 23236 TaxID=1121001 RepID=A0A1W1X8J3_9NEIS|nr:ankyrin repeat domain-containing protein [Andreprevotia lacus]SMC20295.1 Ankyrin repeat-containing protein [Andreprevotia lacus DSM 23236]
MQTKLLCTLALAGMVISTASLAAVNCAKINQRDAAGETPFTMAISGGKTAQVKDMLNRCQPELDKMSKEGWYPLHVAAYYGSVEVIELLVKKGADINARGTYDDMTPLHMAVSYGKPEFVKALLANGADKSLKSASGKTAYDIAKDDNKTTLLALLKP